MIPKKEKERKMKSVFIFFLLTFFAVTGQLVGCHSFFVFVDSVLFSITCVLLVSMSMTLLFKVSSVVLYVSARSYDYLGLKLAV